jgi:AbrB family looped-hinge helix DNA binding protein
MITWHAVLENAMEKETYRYTAGKQGKGPKKKVLMLKEAGATYLAAREAEVHVGPQGRLVIPASLRELLGLMPGDSLQARAEDGRLVLEKRGHVLARLKARFKKVPQEVSLVDALIEERRAEARRERSS